MAKTKRYEYRTYEPDRLGRWAFFFLLILIPLGTVVSEAYITFFYEDVSPALSSPPPTTSSVATTPPNGTFGVFDEGLGKYRKFMLGALIFIIASIIETSLMMVYGTFYVNDPAYKAESLGLPPGSVRIFLLILIVFVLTLFAMLPNSWGENKAVLLLFGMLSTVVGFYYGSRQDSQTNNEPEVKLALIDGSNMQTSDKFNLTARLSANPEAGRSTTILAYLVDSKGEMVEGSERAGVSDSAGLIIFDYTDPALPTLKNKSQKISYVLRVRKPEMVVCDDRLTIDLSGTPPAVP